MVDAATFTAVDLSRLPPPVVVKLLSYEEIYGAMLASFQQMFPGFDATLESDPVVAILRMAAYRELLLRGDLNDAARAVMPAFAVGGDLDQLGALWGIGRLLIDAGDAAQGRAPVYESDDDFRRRLVLAPEGYSVAGPEGAYIFHALSSAPDVLDASAVSPAPGEVLVTVLSRSGNGAPSDALLQTVAAHVSDESVRPLTDAVTVQAAQIIPYAIDATITTFSGPDGGIVLAEARKRAAAYAERQHRLGLDVTLSGIFAAIHTEGVQNVVLRSPAADRVIDRTQASYCTGITIIHAGVGE